MPWPEAPPSCTAALPAGSCRDGLGALPPPQVISSIPRNAGSLSPALAGLPYLSPPLPIKRGARRKVKFRSALPAHTFPRASLGKPQGSPGRWCPPTPESRWEERRARGRVHSPVLPAARPPRNQQGLWQAGGEGWVVNKCAFEEWQWNKSPGYCVGTLGNAVIVKRGLSGTPATAPRQRLGWGLPPGPSPSTAGGHSRFSLADHWWTSP